MIELQLYNKDMYHDWDAFVENSDNGTIFHTHRFLRYHSPNRFEEHHLIYSKGANIIAVLPGAIFYQGQDIIFRSPYGGSFGGWALDSSLTLKDTIEIVNYSVEYWQQLGVNRVYITPPPLFYYKQPNHHLEFCLLSVGFKPLNQELTSVISLKSDIDFMDSCEGRARTAIRKARKMGVAVTSSNDYETFYDILLGSKARHQAYPAHSLLELKDIARRVASKAKLFLALHQGQPIGGFWILQCSLETLLVFYICHLEAYRTLNAPSLLMYEVVQWATSLQIKYIDLGTSTIQMVPNWGLLKFKEGFRSQGYFRNTYVLHF